MRPRDNNLAKELERGLTNFRFERQPLPGIQAPENRGALIEQILESIHRVKYISVISERDIAPSRADPSSEFFDPLKAAILHKRAGRMDEAFWLVFLFVHFGKHGRTGWRRIRDVYGGLGASSNWDWKKTSSNPTAFRKWLSAHEEEIRGHFGNHRKYESLNATSNRGTGAVIESYVNWIAPSGNHERLIREAQDQCNSDPRETFDFLYYSMNRVMSFGRMAKFDYLTMLGKLDLAPIEPGNPYLHGATGPLSGARLLFGSNTLSTQQLNIQLVELGRVLGVGMQVLEDSICNWQKSPSRFKAFRG